MSKQKTAKNSQAFTIIEIMVAVSIFAMVMVVAIGAVLSIVSANKKSQAVSSVLSNLNFSLEAMVRDLRTGYDYECEGSGDCPGGGSSVIFRSTQSGDDVEYGLYVDAEGVGTIYKSVGGDYQYLTSKDVDIETLRFYVIGTVKTPSDLEQPRIVMVIKGVYNGFGKLTEFNLQTMVSQRRLDI